MQDLPKLCFHKLIDLLKPSYSLLKDLQMINFPKPSHSFLFLSFLSLIRFFFLFFPISTHTHTHTPQVDIHYNSHQSKMAKWLLQSLPKNNYLMLYCLNNTNNNNIIDNYQLLCHQSPIANCPFSSLLILNTHQINIYIYIS